MMRLRRAREPPGQPDPVASPPGRHPSMRPRRAPGRLQHAAAAPTRRQPTWMRVPPSATLVLALLLVLLAAPPAAAVRVAVTNCLPDAYQSNTPTPLQWQPLHAEAKFDTKSDSHNLQLTVWGNVTGSQTQDDLPAPDDPYWKNPNETNGKIIETPDPDAVDKKATTLYRRVNVLTYEPWHDAVNLCKNGVVDGSCPLGPVFDFHNASLPVGLPSVNLSHDFFSSYSLSSFTATMLIIYGDAKATNIGCMSAIITPDLGGSAWVPKYLPLIVLLFLGFAVILAGVFSPWGTTNIFHWTSNYGRDTDLLRLVTPGFGDCLQYIQFVVLTGGLSLSYPGFYQPVVSRAAWSALMFNQSLVTHAPAWNSVVDGIYVTNGTHGYGLHQLGQLVGMARSTDIWPGMMVWLCVIVICTFFLVQGCFLVQWLWRKINNISEEDLRAKNIPFSTGNIVRIVFNFMLMPIVALSTFHLVVAHDSPPYTVALAVLTVVLLMVAATWILVIVIKTRPKSVLFDDLPTVLRFGPLYNTYSDEVAAFALIPVLLNFVRGIAIGAVQPSGVAQVVLLAICEVIQIFTLHAFRPFHPSTSMNAYHTLFSLLRTISILLMVAFVPSLGVTEGTKGWIGYAIFLLHGCVLILGFFLSALQTMVEVIARMLGAGGDGATGLRRGGLAKIFGMRQLSRRETHRPGPSRASQLSQTSILDMEDGSRAGFVMPGGRLRSGSSASLRGRAMHHRHRSSSALDSIDVYSAGYRNRETSTSSYIPGTPGETTAFSFLGSGTMPRHAVPLALEAPDPYYRPPRRRTESSRELSASDLPPGLSDPKQAAQANGPAGEPAEAGEDMAQSATPAPPNAIMNLPPNRPDYATREVDFYYGVRGPALNSEGPGRKLGTGPADPTGPVATATGWFRNMFQNKTKEKGKGFEVVRSSRMPPNMMRNGGFGDETPPEGIPVAMGVLRNGPIDSDDDDVDEVRAKRSVKRRPDELLTDTGEAQASGSEPASPVDGRPGQRSKEPVAGAPRIGFLDADLGLPAIPRKSSKRHSAAGSIDNRALSTISLLDSVSGGPSERGTLDGGSTRGQPLPFERTGSLRRPSSKSSNESPRELTELGVQEKPGERPASFGRVAQHGISRVDPENPPTDLLESSAELVNVASSAGKQS